MGWAGGTYVMRDIIEAFVAQEELPADLRARLYIPIIESMEGADWDTQDECLGLDPVFDVTMRELHPDWDWEDIDEFTEDDADES
ncbi:MAG: hypothetical protein ACYS7Y_36520 [Planctomycetota bacterium]|jgi:hypothetical protein